MNKTPLVSIVITTKDRDLLIKRCINSVIKQTYFNLEIIIINDASKDDTERILNEFKKLDSRIKVITNKKTLGSNPSRNIAINIAKGKFIAGLDDDEFLPNRIELLIKNYDDKYAAITSNNIIDDGEMRYSTNMPNIIHLKKMLQSNIAMNQGLIEHKRLLEIGLFDVTLVACQDYDVWIRLILRYGSIKVIKESTQIIYIEKNRDRISSSKRALRGNFAFYKKYKYLMRDIDRKTHLYRMYQIKQKEMSILTEWILSDEKNRHNILKSRINELPDKLFKKQQYYTTVSTLLNLEKIEEIKTPLIIYGYGTIGKFIYNHLKLNIVGIIDKNLSKEFDEALPLIEIGDLQKISRSTILITPIIYYDEIFNELSKYNHNIISFIQKDL